MAVIDKLMAETIMMEVKAATQEIFEKYSLAPPAVRGKYGDVLEIKLTAPMLAPGVHGINLGSAEALAFGRYKVSYGLGHVELGDTFVSGGRTFAISGIATRNRRYPITAQCLADGKGYKFPDSVKHKTFTSRSGEVRVPVSIPVHRV